MRKLLISFFLVASLCLALPFFYGVMIKHQLIQWLQPINQQSPQWHITLQHYRLHYRHSEAIVALTVNTPWVQDIWRQRTGRNQVPTLYYRLRITSGPLLYQHHHWRWGLATVQLHSWYPKANKAALQTVFHPLPQLQLQVNLTSMQQWQWHWHNNDFLIDTPDNQWQWGKGELNGQRKQHAITITGQLNQLRQQSQQQQWSLQPITLQSQCHYQASTHWLCPTVVLSAQQLHYHDEHNTHQWDTLQFSASLKPPLLLAWQLSAKQWQWQQQHYQHLLLRNQWQPLNSQAWNQLWQHPHNILQQLLNCFAHKVYFTVAGHLQKKTKTNSTTIATLQIDGHLPLLPETMQNNDMPWYGLFYLIELAQYQGQLTVTQSELPLLWQALAGLLPNTIRLPHYQTWRQHARNSGLLQTQGSQYHIHWSPS